MKLINELFRPSQFTLLTAPVASGKTRLIVDFYSEHSFKIIFISPLRALANEVYKNLKEKEKNIFLAGRIVKTQECMINFLQAKKAFLISTMELLSEDFLEAIGEQSENIIFIIDEFHLIYHWGDTFRPILHDRWLAILDTQAPVLGLTATMSPEILYQLEADLIFHNDTWVHIDFGNLQLHRAPKKIHYYSINNSKLFARTLWRELRLKEKNDVYLIFCSFRSEVDELVARCQRLGLVCLGCVGGEVENFLTNLEKTNGELDCIFSTTTLSHGVNLPEISKVFINYEVKNFDFWLQMIGRGGRRGGDYEVYTFDTFWITKKNLLKNKFANYLSDYFSDFISM